MASNSARLAGRSLSLEAFASATAKGMRTAAEVEADDASAESRAVELELRFPPPTAEQFAVAVERLGGLGGASPPVGVTVLSPAARKTLDAHERVGDRNARTQTSNIQERVFEGGKLTALAYRRKTQLAPPEQQRRYGAQIYKLAVSMEETIPKWNETDQLRMTYRAKARVSFRWLVEATATTPVRAWRLDLTIARQSVDAAIAVQALDTLRDRRLETLEEFAMAARELGSNVAAARTSKGRAQAMASGLKETMAVGLAASAPTTFEIEAEYMGVVSASGGAGGAAALEWADLDLIAGGVLQVADPAFLVSASYQEQMRAVEQILSGRRSPSSATLRLKTLLPQVLALDRGIYARLYEDVLDGKFFLTPKADGDRALALLYSDRIAILSSDLFVYGGSVRSGLDAATEIRAVLDGEYIASKDPAVPSTFYAFDLLFRVDALSGELRITGEGQVAKWPFRDRLLEMQKVLTHFALLGTDPVIKVVGKEFVKLRGAGGNTGALRSGTAGDELALAGPSGVAAAGPVVRDQAADVKALHAGVTGILETKWPFEIDGLIFIRDGASYTGTVSYKWKPPTHKTVDVLMRQVDDRNDDVAAVAKAAGVKRKRDERLYFLFVGIGSGVRTSLGLPLCPGYETLFGRSSGNYMPIQLQPAADPYAYVWAGPPGLNRKVGEMRVAGMGRLGPATTSLPTRLILELVRIRDDRAGDVAAGGYFGNNFHVAQQVITEALHPLTTKELATGPAGDYFAEEKREMYRAATAFTSLVKSLRISRTFAGSAWVVDFAAGKGQDLGRYSAAGVRNLVAIDIDAAALAELTNRYSSQSKNQGKSARVRSPMRVHTIQANLGDTPTAAMASALKRIGVGEGTGQADGLVCNLAAHYFAATTKTIVAFAALCSAVVKPGGDVVLTIIRGAAVHERLTTEGVGTPPTWTAMEGETIKYRVEKRYGGVTLEKAGQKIALLLPFSQGELYEEYLVNEETFVAAFSVAGMDLVENKDFLAHLKEQAGATKRLTTGDKAHLALYGELVFKKRTI